MAYLEESYLIKSDDESISVSIKKDVFANLEITLKDPSGSYTSEIPEELVSKFVYAINRLINQ